MTGLPLVEGKEITPLAWCITLTIQLMPLGETSLVDSAQCMHVRGPGLVCHPETTHINRGEIFSRQADFCACLLFTRPENFFQEGCVHRGANMVGFGSIDLSITHNRQSHLSK